MFEIIIYILLILSLIYGFYFLIMASGVFRKKKCEIDNNKKNHFAILIAARNEETVIKNLINSLKKQNYPSNKYDVYVIVKNDSFINSIKDINDKKIAVQLGSVADTYVTENYKNAEIVRQKKYLAAIEDLKVGKVDLVVMDELPAKEIIEKNSGIKILDGELTSDSYGMIVKKGNTELLETVNKVLNRLSSDGSIDNFIIKHTEE